MRIATLLGADKPLERGEKREPRADLQEVRKKAQATNKRGPIRASFLSGTNLANPHRMVVNFPIFPEGFGAKSAQILAFRDTTLRLLISGSLVRAQQAEPISTRFHKDVGQSRVAPFGKSLGKTIDPAGPACPSTSVACRNLSLIHI